MFFYSDTKPREMSFQNFDLSRIDGTKKHLEHYDNLLYLCFVASTASSKRGCRLRKKS